MTFDDLREEYAIEPYETSDDSNRGTAWVEMEDCPLDVLQWYLALILRSV